MEVFSVLSFVVGAVGVVLAVIQQIRIGSNRKKDYRRYWDIAKTAHIVMARIEGLKGGIDKIQNCPEDIMNYIQMAWGMAHEASSQMVRMALQNIFLQNVRFDEREIEYWKSKSLLDGYLLKTFEQMRLQPPKGWEIPVPKDT